LFAAGRAKPLPLVAARRPLAARTQLVQNLTVPSQREDADAAVGDGERGQGAGYSAADRLPVWSPHFPVLWAELRMIDGAVCAEAEDVELPPLALRDRRRLVKPPAERAPGPREPALVQILIQHAALAIEGEQAQSAVLPRNRLDRRADRFAEPGPAFVAR